MARNPKPYDGESTPEELIDIGKGIDQDTPTEREEAEDSTKEFGDDEESAA
jgi:hypothetical protein